MQRILDPGEFFGLHNDSGTGSAPRLRSFSGAAGREVFRYYFVSSAPPVAPLA